jgi:hypothetical protein
MTGTDAALNDLTVSQFLSIDNAALGGADTGFTFTDLDIELAEINNAFDDGQPSAFAQDHLVAPASSAAMPEPSSLLLLAIGIFGVGFVAKKRVLA